MTIETIPAVKARTHFGEIMKKSFKKGARFVVEKSGIPMVVILNAQDYNRMVQVQNERFAVLDEIKSKIPQNADRIIAQDVSKAIAAVRRKHA